MIKEILLIALAALLTSCAGQITMIEYDYYGVPVKRTEIYILVAPSPMPVDAKPPIFQPVRL